MRGGHIGCCSPETWLRAAAVRSRKLPKSCILFGYGENHCKRHLRGDSVLFKVGLRRSRSVDMASLQTSRAAACSVVSVCSDLLPSTITLPTRQKASNNLSIFPVNLLILLKDTSPGYQPAGDYLSLLDSSCGRRSSRSRYWMVGHLQASGPAHHQHV